MSSSTESSSSPVTQCFVGHFIDAPVYGSVSIHSHHCCAVNSKGYINLFQEWPHQNTAAQNEFKQKYNLTSSSIIWHIDDESNDDDGSRFYIPSFIDTHIHAPQYTFTGAGTGLTLLQWLETHTFPAESAFSDLKHAHKVYSQLIAQLLRQGTTSAVMYATIHLEATKLLVDLCQEAGIRAIVGKVNMDQNSPSYYIDESTELSLQQTREFIKYVHSKNNHLLIPCLTPRFLPTCSPKLLHGLSLILNEHIL
jgi:cytosine/adenosine deaminase-related metal-dependent hydrolase